MSAIEIGSIYGKLTVINNCEDHVNRTGKYPRVMVCCTCGKEYSITASLDRIDSSIGYIKSNIQWVHKRVNLIKSDMDQKDLLYWCSLIVDNLKRTNK